MPRRLRQAVLIAVLALQMVLAPAIFASSMSANAASAGSHCPEQMQHGGQPCPCCPEGGVMVAGCMSLCTAFASASAALASPLRPVPAPAIPFKEPISATQTYPPLNPPPIV